MLFQFIFPEADSPDKKQRHPASYLRKTFEVTPDLQKAVLHMTALGMYHPSINGKEITDRVLLPGFTDYSKRLQYQSFEVSDYLEPGTNVIGCILGDGWYRGCVGAYGTHNVYGDNLALAAVLELHYPDGIQTIHTDETWMASQSGPLRQNDLKSLEVYDATFEKNGWNFPDFQDPSWHPCITGRYEGSVVADLSEPVRPKEEFRPYVLQTPNGGTVLDFGQNMAGYVQFTVTGPAGHTVELVMGETLDAAGNFTLKNLQGTDEDPKMMALGQKLCYTLKEGRQTYKPFSLLCGFRYCLLKNWPEEVKPENFLARAVYSDLPYTGTFTCSNPKINRLVDNIRWSMKSNFVDIPTDCPQRERLGWAGDIGVFIETANYLADTRVFLDKWMIDFIDSQKENGDLPYIIPNVPVMGAGSSAAGWSDAIYTLPLAQYWHYGKTDLLEQAYPAIKRYVDFNTKRAKKRHITHVLKREVHYDHILDTGFHYGEWLEPGGSNITDALKAMLLPDAEVATAWYFYACRNLSEIAGILGKLEDQRHYASLAESIREAYRKEFLPKGTVSSGRQCKYVRPVYMGLAEPDESAAIIQKLNDLCAANRYRIGTGFLTTYRILQTLTDWGYGETAYHILENEECPGWLHEVNCGATTVWEGWDAIDSKGNIKPLSMNHYAPGAALSWLFTHCAGITPLEPGFRKVQIRPVPGGSLTYAEADVSTVQGKIRVKWELTGTHMRLEVSTPTNMEVVVLLPDSSRYEHRGCQTYLCRI